MDSPSPDRTSAPAATFTALTPTPRPSPDLAAYITDLVRDWPPLTPEQIATLRSLFDPVR